MITIKELKESEEIRVHTPSGKGYAICNNKQIPFDIMEIDDVEIVKYILANGTQVQYEHDIRMDIGEVFEYVIDNGYDYECNMHTSLYSFQCLSRKKFKEMCNLALEKMKQSDKRMNDIYEMKKVLKELFPETFIEVAMKDVIVLK